MHHGPAHEGALTSEISKFVTTSCRSCDVVRVLFSIYTCSTREQGAAENLLLNPLRKLTARTSSAAQLRAGPPTAPSREVLQRASTAWEQPISTDIENHGCSRETRQPGNSHHVYVGRALDHEFTFTCVCVISWVAGLRSPGSAAGGTFTSAMR